MVTQLGWGARLTRAIAGEVRRYRKERGVSAQQLADKCSALGLEMSRSAITDLENDRRAAISIAELLVLAAALEVSPLVLAIPLGRQEEIEILPGKPVSTWRAADWWQGWRDLDGQLPGPRESAEPLALSELHARMLALATSLHADNQEDRPNSERALAGVRRMMRESFGLIPPPLPPELAYIDKLDPGPYVLGITKASWAVREP